MCILQSVIKKKTHPKDKALEHFDDFYGSVYGKQWKSMRLALLSPHKYMAIVNNFSNAEKISQELEVCSFPTFPILSLLNLMYR